MKGQSFLYTVEEGVWGLREMRLLEDLLCEPFLYQTSATCQLPFYAISELLANIHPGKLFGLEKEWNSDIYYNINELWKQYTKWNKPDIYGAILYDSTYVRYVEKKHRFRK